MVVSINGNYADRFINGVTVKEALSPANETVSRGRYTATTLSAVDGDLVVGNIKDGVTIFGVLGTFVGGALAEDIVGSQWSTIPDVNDQATTVYYTHDNIDDGADLDIAAKTQAYTAGSLAVGVAFCYFEKVDDVNAVKIRLYMGGVNVAESAFLANRDGRGIAVGTRALSGNVECKACAHNSVGSTTFVESWGILGGTVVHGGIGIGSVKT